MVAGNMVIEKSLGWITDIGSGMDITTTRAEAGVITAEVAVAAIIMWGRGITDMVNLCSVAL
jgi:hypothetical protein